MTVVDFLRSIGIGSPWSDVILAVLMAISYYVGHRKGRRIK